MNTGLVWIGSGLALFFVKPLMANEIVKEDGEVRAYIEAHV